MMWRVRALETLWLSLTRSQADVVGSRIQQGKIVDPHVTGYLLVHGSVR
jgi:hypothetical protein